jgi:DnaJ-class molecular chaperone
MSARNIISQLASLSDAEMAAVIVAIRETNARRPCPCPRCQGGGFDPDTEADCPRCEGKCDVERGSLTDAEKADLRVIFDAESLAAMFGL